MKLIDLSREIHHKMARLPNHPMVIIAPFSTHEEKRVADGYVFSSAVTSLNMGDHSGTHSMPRCISTNARVPRASTRCRWRATSPISLAYQGIRDLAGEQGDHDVWG
jgi:hypothetical protein